MDLAAFEFDHHPDVLVGLEVLGQLFLHRRARGRGRGGSGRIGHRLSPHNPAASRSRSAASAGLASNSAAIRVLGGFLGARLRFDRLGLVGARGRREHALDHRRRAAQPAFLQILDARRRGAPGHDLGPRGAQGVCEGAAPDFGGAFEHGDEAGQGRAQHLHAAFGAALQIDRARRGVEAGDLGNIGELIEAEPAGDAGTDLRRVAVDRLLAGEDDVGRAPGLADLADRLGERVARRQSVGAGEETVGEQHRAIGAERERLAQRILGRRRTHGEDRHFAALLVAQPQRRFEREQIIGVDDRRHALAHDRVGDRMDADLRRVRNLLDANDEVHGASAAKTVGPLNACAVPSAANIQ